MFSDVCVVLDARICALNFFSRDYRDLNNKAVADYYNNEYYSIVRGMGGITGQKRGKAAVHFSN